MAEVVRGVVARSEGDPVTVESIVVPDPGPGEVTVRVQACGVCHTDLHYREGGINDDFPFLLGHEAAGVVEAVGPDVTGLEPGEFVHTFGDAHLYSNHLEQARLQLTREPYPPPEMKLNPDVKDIFDFRYADFELVGYEAHPHIKAEIAV